MCMGHISRQSMYGAQGKFDVSYVVIDCYRLCWPRRDSIHKVARRSSKLML